MFHLVLDELIQTVKIIFMVGFGYFIWVYVGAEDLAAIGSGNGVLTLTFGATMRLAISSVMTRLVLRKSSIFLLRVSPCFLL